MKRERRSCPSYGMQRLKVRARRTLNGVGLLETILTLGEDIRTLAWLLSLLWMAAQYKEFTDVAFEEVMLLDCTAPLYLHWQEKAFFNWEEMSFFNKQEYLMQSNIFTKGKLPYTI